MDKKAVDRKLREGAHYCEGMRPAQYPTSAEAWDNLTAEEKTAINAAWSAYYVEVNRLRVQFRDDAFAALGLTEHPKRHDLAALAWAYGDAQGLPEVWLRMKEMSKLLEQAA